MNFDNADLHDVLRTFGDLLGISYIVDPRAKGTVTVQTAGRINKEDLFPLLQEVLRLNGLTAVKVGGVYEIVPFTDAKGKPVSPSVGKDPTELPGEERIVIQIARLKFLTTAEITKVLKPFLSPGGEIVEYPRSNTLLIADLSSYVKRLLEMINIFDVEEEASEESGVRTYVYSVQNGKAKDLANVLTQVFAKGPARPVPTTTAAPPARPAAPGAPTAPAPAAPPAPVAAALAVPGHEGEMRIVADEVTNSLIIQAAPKEYKAVKELLKKLDIVPRQVLLEVLVAELSLTDDLRFGLEFAFKNRQLTYKGSKYTTEGGIDFSTVSTAAGAYFFSLSKVDWFSALLNTLASENKLSILASPRVLAADNKTATINVSEEIPIITQTAPSTAQEGGTTLLTTTIQYRNIGLILKVTPSINVEGLVRLDISQEASQVKKTTVEIVSGVNTPSFLQRKVETTAVLQDGETLVIGGLIQDTNERGYSGLPLLSKIPLLGALFRDTRLSSEKRELVIMITPNVIRNKEEAQKVSSEFLDKVKGLKERIEREKEKQKPPAEQENE
jgi:general secretion pathway protein D